MTETLGDRLAQARRDKSARDRRDVTRLEIAKAAGVDSSMVSQYESGAKVPREDTLEKLATFLGVTPAFLRYGVVPQFSEVVPGKELLSDFLDRENAKREANETAAQSEGGRRRRGGGKAS